LLTFPPIIPTLRTIFEVAMHNRAEKSSNTTFKFFNMIRILQNSEKLDKGKSHILKYVKNEYKELFIYSSSLTNKENVFYVCPPTTNFFSSPFFPLPNNDNSPFHHLSLSLLFLLKQTHWKSTVGTTM